MTSSNSADGDLNLDIDLGDIEVEITSGEIVNCKWISDKPVSKENIENIGFRKLNNPRYCNQCKEQLIRVDRIPASTLCTGLSSTLFAGSPYQKVFCGPRCFFPMGICCGYNCLCSGCCGYWGCVATPISCLICPVDFVAYICCCCNVHPCSQRRSKCRHPYCDRNQTNTFARDITDTCCDCTDGYPLEFDDHYYICPQCRDKANKPCCFNIFTEYDNEVNESGNYHTCTVDYCKDCAFFPLLDDKVLTSNTFAKIDGDFVPVYVLKRSDGFYDVRRNFFGPGKGQTNVLSGSMIFKRVLDSKVKQNALNETCGLDSLSMNPNWLLIIFGAENNPFSDEFNPTIKDYAQMIDQSVYYAGRSELRFLRKIDAISRSDFGIIDKVEVKYPRISSPPGPQITKKSIQQVHIFKCIEEQPTGVKYPIITRDAYLEEGSQPWLFMGGSYDFASNLEAALEYLDCKAPNAVAAYYFSSDPTKPARINWYLKWEVARTLTLSTYITDYDATIIEFKEGLRNGNSNSSSKFPVITHGALLAGDDEGLPTRFDGGGQYDSAKNLQEAIEYVQTNAPNAVVAYYFSKSPDRPARLNYYCVFEKSRKLSLSLITPASKIPESTTEIIEGTVIELEPGLMK